MAKQGYSAEQIVNKLREADVELAKGRSVLEACRQIEVTGKTYYRWRREYGGLKVDQAKRMKELEAENARLKRIVPNQEIDMAILREAARPNLQARRGDAGRSITWSIARASPSDGRARSCTSRAARSGIA
jgi:transposase-like protein